MFAATLRWSVALIGLLVAAAAAPLRVGVEAADAPLSFRDASEQPTGFSAELLREMSRLGGFEIEIVSAPWSIILEQFKAGKLDALANVVPTDARRETMDFSISHAYVRGVVYRRGDRPRIRRSADLAGKTFAVLGGTISAMNARANQGWGGTLRTFTNQQEAIDATMRGEIDATLLVYAMDRKYIVNDHGLRRDFIDDMVYKFHFAVPKGESLRLAQINEALATVRDNGTFDALYTKWLGSIEPRPIRLTDLRPHATEIGLGALIIAAVFWWQRHMLRKVSLHADALRDSEERYRGLIDSAFHGSVIHRDGYVLEANASFAAMVGYCVEELPGKSLVDLIAPNERKHLSEAFSSPGSISFETVGLRKDGSLFPMESSGRPCRFKGQPAQIVAIRDLTSRKQAEADRLVLSKLESTGILAGGIAHDFNNLLSTIVLNLDLLRRIRYDDSAVAAHTSAAKQAAMAATTLTQQLITFSGGGSSTLQPTHLGDLIKRSVPLALSGANVMAEIAVSNDLWLAVIDAGPVERAVRNLVQNAREAMPAGGVVNVRVDNQALKSGNAPGLKPGDYVRVTIHDDGPGMTPDIQAKIFDPYFSTKQRGEQKGMGLGLTISHSVVHRQGGTITVDSSPGSGSTFTLYLPANRQAKLPAPHAMPLGSSYSGRVLVMDDEEALRQSLRLALRSMGCDVVVAAEGKSAVELYAKAKAAGTPFDFVIFDLTVRGGMGGKEAMQAVRELDPDAMGVAMTGYSSDEVLRNPTTHGFKEGLAKPFDFDALERLLARCLAARKPGNEGRTVEAAEEVRKL
jgi:two-component system cell cycle sensor histidine kinase/response regulator CckA